MSEADGIYKARIARPQSGNQENVGESLDPGLGQATSGDDFFRDSLSIIGPAKCGKTALIVSLPQACRLRLRNEPALSIVTEMLEFEKVAVGDDAEHTLQVEDVARMLRGGVSKICELDDNSDFAAGTEQPYVYPLSVKISNIAADLKLRVIDGPGGGLFPSRREEAKSAAFFDCLAKACAKTKRLLLCVSSTNPDVDLVSQNLDSLLQSIIRNSPVPNRLPFERVLVMLTKVDRLALDFVNQLQSRVYKTPLEVARLISPKEQVKELLGIHVLEAIRSRLLDGSKMAVGLSSAAGFDSETGNAMIGLDGRIIRLDSEHLQESGQSMLNRWRPFGVREALYFLAGGEPRGSIALYTEEDSYIYEDDYSVQMEVN